MSGRRRRISAAVSGDSRSEFAPRISASGRPAQASNSGQRIGGRALEGREEGVAQRGVVGDAQALGRLAYSAAAPRPASARAARSRSPANGAASPRPARHGSGPTGCARHSRRCAPAPRARSPGPTSFRHRPSSRSCATARQQHADQPAARGAEDRGLLHAEMVQQRKRIRRLCRHGVGRGPGPVATRRARDNPCGSAAAAADAGPE